MLPQNPVNKESPRPSVLATLVLPDICALRPPDKRARPHQSVLTMARVTWPMSRMRAGIGKRVLAIITATA